MMLLMLTFVFLTIFLFELSLIVNVFILSDFIFENLLHQKTTTLKTIGMTLCTHKLFTFVLPYNFRSHFHYTFF